MAEPPQPQEQELAEARLLERMLLGRPITPLRAGRLIAATSLALTLLGGLLAWLIDKGAVGSLSDSLWWSLQTVTTVGYGDIVPENATGRAIGALLMLNGLALASVITAVVTAMLIEQTRRRRSMGADAELRATLTRIESRLSRIEAGLDRGDRTGGA